MVTFRFIGSVNYSDDLQYKKAQIGDTCHVMWEGKRGDKHPKFVNAVYCYMGDWVNIECDNNDQIYYAIETFVRIGEFHSRHSNFKTDTVVVLAEVNKTKGTVECCNIWPEIMNEPEMRWELSEMMYQSIAAKNCFTTESGVAASIEYNSQIDTILSKRKDDF